MQNENSGSSYHKKQEDMKRLHTNQSRITPDVGGNAYTAAFILYCQKTLDNFRRVYGDLYAPDAGIGSGPSFSFGSEPESENDAFELKQDYSNSDKDNDALRELSAQFERMLKARSELEDEELELDEDEEAEFDDYKEKEELEELFAQFEKMFNAKTDLEEDEELELDEDEEAESDDYKEREELEELFAQFEKMFNAKTDLEEDEAGDDDYRPSDYEGNEELKEFLEQFEQILDIKNNTDDDEFEWEKNNQSHHNVYSEEEDPEEIFEQNEQAEETVYEADKSNSDGEEDDAMEVSSLSHSEGLNDAEIDEALSGVGEVVKLAKENLAIVEAFWEQSASEGAMLFAKAQITQEQFEQIVTRAGSYLYDVKDCLEGWGDLSMLPEIYEQLFLANNELSEIFEKMYGKAIVEELDTGMGSASEEEEDDWDLDGGDDWNFCTDDDDD